MIVVNLKKLLKDCFYLKFALNVNSFISFNINLLLYCGIFIDLIIKKDLYYPFSTFTEDARNKTVKMLYL